MHLLSCFKATRDETTTSYPVLKQDQTGQVDLLHRIYHGQDYSTSVLGCGAESPDVSTQTFSSNITHHATTSRREQTNVEDVEDEEGLSCLIVPTLDAAHVHHGDEGTLPLWTWHAAPPRSSRPQLWSDASTNVAASTKGNASLGPSTHCHKERRKSSDESAGDSLFVIASSIHGPCCCHVARLSLHDTSDHLDEGRTRQLHDEDVARYPRAPSLRHELKRGSFIAPMMPSSAMSYYPRTKPSSIKARFFPRENIALLSHVHILCRVMAPVLLPINLSLCSSPDDRDDDCAAGSCMKVAMAMVGCAGVPTNIHYQLQGSSVEWLWLLCPRCPIGCCLIPCCIPSCMTVKHKCPNCHTSLGKFVEP
ncbi:hypothetical protein HAZT_HAZT002502 [Hyalella azteca]|uniref:LITAF domain-containing protein n=1 Tax=Hyalella azteca TaxID=294128 RepID=A0A6A0GW01_HYAAZ|nr:hypothetical protein HAZT_HAZT002502 [Hyalella azteca]